MKKGKGFTLIELLAVIVILSLIMLIATPIVIKTIEDAKRGAFKNSVYGIIKASELNYARKLLENNNSNKIKYSYQDGVESSLTGDIKLDYKGTKPQNGTIIIDKDGKVALALHNGQYCVTKNYNSDTLTLEKISLDKCLLIETEESSEVNFPKLVTGMTPIYWEKDEEGNYIEKETDKTDSNWFNYEEKRWANAKTKDGSYWVWIPRYAYKIIKGYHENSNEGKIDVKFLQGITNLSLDGTFIETSGYDRETKNTRDNYFLHPAFKFGDDDILGFWVAKFSPSNSNNKVKVVPNASIWRSVSVSDAFNLCREMETKTDVYGWTLKEVDTHMIKNMEWGAVAYLSKSQYGADGKVWHNSYNDYQTGCSSENDEAASSGICIKYNTENGVKASTTHNIYGVYDMRGGAWKYVMGNLLNALGKRQDKSAGFDNIDEIDDKYIDEYTVYHSNKYGDAIYETSEESSGITSWGWAYSNFINNSHSWLLRGGNYGDTSSGLFWFSHYAGGLSNFHTFRPVVVLG